MDADYRNKIFNSIKNIYVGFVILAMSVPIILFIFGKYDYPILIILLVLLLIIFITSFVISCKCDRNGLWEEYSYIGCENKINYHLCGDDSSFYCDFEMYRKIKSNTSHIDYMSIRLPKSEVSLPLRLQGDIEIVNIERAKGSVEIQKPNKHDDVSIQFKVNFNPPLAKNEEVGFRLKFKAVNLHASKTEHLEKFAHNNEYEFNSFYVRRRMWESRYEVQFDKECKVEFLGMEVTRGESNGLFEEERRFIDSNKCVEVSENNGMRIVLTRKRPPVGTRYTFKWRHVV